MIVTVSREYGAMGHAVTQGLAARLGYRLVDDELPKVVAARLGTSPDVVESAERPTTFGERFLRSLGTPIPEAFQPVEPHEDLTDAALREVEALIRDAAAGGRVVIVGRCGHVVLSDRSDVVRVFLHAPLPWRAAHLAESLGVTPAAARVEAVRVDAARRDFARDRYDVTWGDPHHYDVVIDVAAFGASGTVELLAAAVGVRA